MVTGTLTVLTETAMAFATQRVITRVLTPTTPTMVATTTIAEHLSQNITSLIAITASTPAKTITTVVSETAEATVVSITSTVALTASIPMAMTHPTVQTSATQAAFTAVDQLLATRDLPMATVVMDASTQHQAPLESQAVADSATAPPTLLHPLLIAEPQAAPFIANQNFLTKALEATILAAPPAGLSQLYTDTRSATLAHMARGARIQEVAGLTMLAMSMAATAMVDRDTPL